MTSHVRRLQEKGIIKPEPWVAASIHYEAITGSVSYGVSNDMSDMDIVGFCVPPKHLIFPHLNGEIEGFTRQKKRFEQWQKHHITYDEKNYDIAIYSIVKFFSLCMENNPNMIDSLFVPDSCVIHSTPLSEHVRSNRKLFLHKGCWHKFKGYAYSQLHKIKGRVNTKSEKRKKDMEQHGFDCKFAYHVVRLIDEVEQILTLGSLDLTRAAAMLKAIRNGEWSEEKIVEYFDRKTVFLEEAYEKSTLPYGPDEKRIKILLLECLEMHYGNLSNAVVDTNKLEQALRQIQTIVSNVIN